MFAVIKTGGKQYRVAPNDKIIVEKILGEAGSIVSINNVLLLETSEGELKFGNPIVEGVSVEAEIIRTFKGKKVIIFKKRRRQNSRRKKGHRQQHTELRVKSIQA
ncbi:MAG: 50S ribosomal protein L21 [Rickettsiales bacterium]|nr:50S ribosomal protein L21 [Rickettsiales bacterium]